ncbi:sulfatase [Halorarius litoreus]|uniref:sulfatase n=1 Tax=Halorarius litoreus TaxID=2962676 RepID=UPI0020CD6C92|nr:sulfatase [Halorarius litoreus]
MTKRDILWITLESIRWDHTSFSDHTRDTTPKLQAWSQQPGVTTLNNCFSHGIYTRSSSASILSGRAASNHGVGMYRDVLPSSVTTIPEQLRACGYQTVCISPNGHLSHGTGLHRGFDEFVYIVRDTVLSEVPYHVLLKYLVNLREHSGGFTTNTKKHCISYIMNELLKTYAADSASGDDPVFLYAHYGDTHHSYCPPVAWRGRFDEDLQLSIDEAIEFALYMSNNILELIARGCDLSAAEWNALEVLYDTLIAYVDHMVADVVAELSSVLNDPVIVITADHGENFGEDGLLGHRLTVNRPLAHVPMLFKGIDNDLDPDTLVQHADVFSMICEELDLDVEIPAGIDVRASTRDVAVTQMGGRRCSSNLDEIQSYNPRFDRSSFSEEDVTALIAGDHIYRRTDTSAQLSRILDSGGEVELTNRELRPVFEQHYKGWVEAVGRPISAGPDTEPELDATIQQHLRDMGYLVD